MPTFSDASVTPGEPTITFKGEGLQPPREPTAIAFGQQQFQKSIQNFESTDAEIQRLKDKLGMSGGVPDPKAPAPEAQPETVINVKKYNESATAAPDPQAAPWEQPNLSAPKNVDKTQMQKPESVIGGLAVGTLRAGEGVWNLIKNADDYIAKTFNGPNPVAMKPSTYFANMKLSDDPATQLSAAFGQHVLPFAIGGSLASAGLKIAGISAEGAAAATTRLVTSGAVNAAIADPHGTRFGALLGKYAPALQNPFFEYLAQPDSSELEGRWKNALDAAIPDATMAGVMYGFPKAINGFRELLGKPQDIVPVNAVTANRQLQDIIFRNGGATKIEGSTPGDISFDVAASLPQVKESLAANAADAEKSTVSKIIQDVGSAPPEELSSGFVNPATLSGPQHRSSNIVQQAVQDYIERIGVDKLRARTTGPLTMEEIDKGALDVLADIPGFTNLIKNYQPGDHVTSEQLRAVHMFTTDLFNQMVSSEERALQSGLASDIAYRDQKMTEFATVAQVLLGAGEKAGRDLGILSKSTSISDPAKFRAAMNAVESMGGINEGLLRIEQVKKMRELLKEGAVSSFMSGLSKTGGSVMDALNYAALTGMVSRPSTAVRNFAASFGRQMINMGSDVNIRLLGLVPGMGQDVQDAGKIAAARMSGNWLAYKEATKAALETLHSGKTFYPTMYDFNPGAIPGPMNVAAEIDGGGRAVLKQYYSHVVNAVQAKNELLSTRLIKTSDSFGGMIAAHRSLIEDAVNEGLQSGLSGDGLSELIALRLKSPSGASYKKAMNAARENAMSLSYQDLFKGTDVGEAVGGGLQKIDSALASWKLSAVAPFMKQKANEAVQALEVLPGIGLLAPRTYAAFKQGGSARVEAIAKMLTTAEILGGSFALTALAGYEFTGSGPTDPRTMQAIKEINPGYQPYSIKTPSGEYVSFNNVGMLSHVLRVMGDFQEIHGMLGPDQKAKLASGMAAHLADMLTPTQLTQDIPELFNALHDLGPEGNGKALTTLAEQMGARVVPLNGLLSSIAQEMDPNKRATIDKASAWNTAMNKVKAEIPGWSTVLPPDRNIFGHVVGYPSGYGPRIVSPFFSSNGDAQLQHELIRLGIYNTGVVDMPQGATTMEISKPSRSLIYHQDAFTGKIDLDPIQYDRLIQYSAGINIPAGVINDSDALGSADISGEDRQLLLQNMSNGTMKTLEQALKDTLKKLDLKPIHSELQRDEYKRLAVKSLITNYQKLGRAAMFLETADIAKIQKQMQNRAKVLKGMVQ